MNKVATRFAPSPTGFLHVGGVRTALFAWLIARQHHGRFVLRLEDTDKNREVTGSADHLIASLKALGLDYDEGPDIGGPYGPYRQSDRLDIYKEWAQKLIDAGRAYADPYTPAEVQAFREQAQKAKQPFLYRNHRPEDPVAWDGSTPLRFKSDPKAYRWHDEVMGDLSTGPEVIDDIILIKSDGYPTYNFAHIVDDAEMHITHIIRGQEFLASTPNYLNIYEALGFDMGPTQHEAKAELQGVEQDGEFISPLQRRGEPLLPIFATMPHILNEQGNKKLGKRDGAKDVLDYIRDGYLPEALRSFIATLGWNDGTTQEVFTTDELIEKFRLERVGKSGAHFDEQRLNWVNGHFIRGLDSSAIYTLCQDFWPAEAASYDKTYKKQVLSLVQERLKYFAELPELTRFFFTDLPPNLDLITTHKQLKKLSPTELLDLLDTVEAALKDCDFTHTALQARLNSLLEQTGQKPATLFSLVRVATTWAPASPGLAETLAVLGKERTLQRLAESRRALQ